MRKVVGLDGCKGGWIAAVMVDGKLQAVEYHESAHAAVEAHVDAAVFAFDIPIGLSENDKRAADGAAYEFLPDRKSSVFNAPPQAALDIFRKDGSHAQASDESKRVAGYGISAQAWGLMKKIAEVDFIKDDAPIFEAHPEVSFTELAGGQRIQAKRTWNGLIRRWELLKEAGLVIPNQLGVAGDHGAPDDVVDAVACAWTAERIAKGVACLFPDPPERIGNRDVAIWC